MPKHKGFACHSTEASINAYFENKNKREDEKRAEAFLAQKPLKVTLRIEKDENVGLTMFIFEYFDVENKSYKMECEIANRYANDRSFSPCNVLAFDPKIDGEIGESKRKMKEFILNQPIGI